MNTNKHRLVQNLVFLIIIILFCTSLWQLASAGWIQSKAITAQLLLNSAWQQTIEESETNNAPGKHRPWPWADTWPVAKLILPQHDIEQIILAGDSGSSLAFGPGYSLASSEPNTTGTTVISGHRDTHFSFIKDIKINELIILQTPEKTINYRIVDFQIVDSETYTLHTDTDNKNLVLVTCYPFDAVDTGSTLRYLVYATEYKTRDNLT